LPASVCVLAKPTATLLASANVSASRSTNVFDDDFIVLFEGYKKKVKMLENVSAEEFVSFDDKRPCEKQLSVKDCVAIAREYLRRFSLNRNRRKGVKKENEKNRENEKEKRENDVTSDVEVATGTSDVNGVGGKPILESLALMKRLFGAKNASVEEMKAMKVVEAKLTQIFSTNLLQQNISQYFALQTEKQSEKKAKEKVTIRMFELRRALQDEVLSAPVVEEDDDEFYYASADGDDADGTAIEKEAEEGAEKDDVVDGENSEEESSFFDEYNVQNIDDDYVDCSNGDLVNGEEEEDLEEECSVDEEEEEDLKNNSPMKRKRGKKE
jgi:hypothetical protein